MFYKMFQYLIFTHPRQVVFADGVILLLIFGYGFNVSATAVTNLVSNTGVVATDTAGVGTARRHLAAAAIGA